MNKGLVAQVVFRAPVGPLVNETALFYDDTVKERVCEGMAMGQQGCIIFSLQKRLNVRNPCLSKCIKCTTLHIGTDFAKIIILKVTLNECTRMREKHK